MEDGKTTACIPEKSILRPLGDLTIFEAAQFHADLLALHQQEGPLQIDLKEVNCMDVSCVQLMVAATRSGRVTVLGYSSRIRDKFAQIGFEQFLPNQVPSSRARK
jgi:anti-anti-sigma regulatory factor